MFVYILYMYILYRIHICGCVVWRYEYVSSKNMPPHMGASIGK